MQPIAPVTETTSGTAATPGRAPGVKQAARQFEAMFMTEMLHHARPPSKAAGPFAAGRGENAWQVFMDQALGQAAAANGPAGDRGLAHVIEKALQDAQRRAGGRTP